MADMIKRIVDLRGPSVIADKTFAGLLSDLAVDFPKEWRWIKSAVSEFELGKVSMKRINQKTQVTVQLL
jgi:hypothetical protein